MRTAEPCNVIAERLKRTKAKVGKWRLRFIERRTPGLYDDAYSVKQLTADDERVVQLVVLTRQTKPANGSTHWSVSTVAPEAGISKTAQCYFQRVGTAA